MKKYYSISARPFLRLLLSIVVVVLLELTWVFFVGTGREPYVFVIFYSLDISYFLLLTFIYVPLCTIKVKFNALRMLLYLVPIVAYTLLIAVVGDILESIQHGRLSIEITKVDFFSLFNRSSYVFVLAAMYWYARYSVQKEKEANLKEIQRLELEKKNIQLESDYLRAQVNPHFLFNTLTTIYNKVNKKAPDEAEAILKLAGMMDYAMSAPSEDGTVHLKEDIANLRHLVDLHQMQYHGILAVTFLVNVQEDLLQKPVPPLLFLDAVENVFKYGKLNDTGKPAVIQFFNFGPMLRFVSRNFVAASREGGIATGLNNTERRLQKHLPGRYRFDARTIEDEFLLDITIAL